MIFREAIDAIIGGPRRRGGEREVRMQVASSLSRGRALASRRS
jgi:hypothetical protein